MTQRLVVSAWRPCSNWSRGNVRRNWLTVNYLVALTIGMMGWIWLIVWLARHLI
jgi:hypothetical protein